MGQILHTCSEPMCREKIPMDKVRCPKHEQEQWQKYWDKKNSNKTGSQSSYERNKRYDQTKRSSRSQFYHSTKWKKYRKIAVMRVNNECAACGNISQNKKICDHIYPLRLDSSIENALGKDATMILCLSCHNVKTKLEDKMLAMDNGQQRMKDMTKDDWVKLIRKVKGSK